MALRNASLTVNFTVWNTVTNTGQTGDVANLTLRLIKDGGLPAAPTNSISEPDSINMRGVYEIVLTATEMDANFIALAGESSTGDVVVIPTYIHTERGVLPLVAPATSGGLPTVDANNRISGIQGTLNTLDDLPTAIQVADAILQRDIDQVETTAAVHSLCTAILKGIARVRDNVGTLEIYRTDGVTIHAQQTVTTDASLDPVDELGGAV